ncbi:MAG: glyoxalase [Phenylobacterium sp.]|nr:glyoxalase [Phenylobacterium sp.]
MDQRVSMIMTGAQDIPKLRAFYEDGLGWTPWMPANEASVLYRVGHAVLVFLNGGYLAQERGEQLSQGSKTSLAVFVESKVKVDEIYQRAIKAGATQTSGVRDRDGGLYTGYFADPEGNSWEVVWSPHMPLDAQGALTLPGQAG